MDILIAVGIAGIICIFSSFVLIQNRYRVESVYFFILCVMLAIWTISSAMTNHYFGEDLTVNRFANHLAYATALLAVLCGVLFSRIFPVRRSMKFIPLSFIVILSLFMTLISFSGLISGDVILDGQQLAFVSGKMIGLYLAVLSIYILFIFMNLIHAVRFTSGRARYQARLLLGAFVSAALVGIVSNIVLPLIGMDIKLTTRFAPLAALFFVMPVAYAIVRHGLFDIKTAAIRSITYVSALLILAVMYYFVAYIFSIVLFADEVGTKLSLSPLNIFLALSLSFMFQPIKMFFDQLTNRIFYRGDYDHDEFLKQFGKIISYDTDLYVLLRQSGSYMAATFKAERVFFHILHRGIFGVGGASKMKREIPDVDVAILTDYYRQNHEVPEVMVRANVTSERVRKILENHKAQLALPLEIQGEFIGCLFVGDHKGRGFRTRDIQSIESVANELTIAVQNSMSVEEIRDLNESLRYKVDTATKELRTSNKQLHKLDETKNEFISMASHQLRTPLTSIKGYLDMVLQGDLGKVSSTQKAVLSEAFMSSERMVALINDFLNVSRLQTGKFLVEKSPKDLAVILKDELQMMSVMADQRDLKIKEKIAKDIPMVDVDAEKLRQVIVNMVDNAIYYSAPGTTVDVSLAQEGGEVVFTVKDTGIGVPKSEQSSLFSKFFRASNARKKRPDGTGIGLFLAKKVITLHGGQIIFNSQENKGSTFGFRLPIR